MKEKSINDCHNTDSIDWEIYWEFIDTLDGQVKKSYGEIAKNICLSTINEEKFVSGIIQSMLRKMNHPMRRRMWDLNILNRRSKNQ